MARPTTFDRETFDAICARIAEGQTLREVCRDPVMPARSTVQGWVIADNPPGISGQYARAREMQFEAWSDQIIEIADTPTIGEKVTIKADGSREVVTGDTVDRAKLRADSRKWLLSKLARRTYGDKPAGDGGGGEADNLTIVIKGGLPS